MMYGNLRSLRRRPEVMNVQSVINRLIQVRTLTGLDLVNVIHTKTCFFRPENMNIMTIL